MNNIKDTLIKEFVENPEREFHVRELSKKFKKSPTTISKYLKLYKNQGVLQSKIRYNHLFFRAKISSNKYKILKLYSNLSKIYDSGVIDYLKEKLNEPKSIVLFGSFAKAENNKKSDIDLFIQTSAKNEISLKAYEKKIGSKIQLFLSSDREINEMKNKNPELLNNIINGITLYGLFEVFK